MRRGSMRAGLAAAAWLGLVHHAAGEDAHHAATDEAAPHAVVEEAEPHAATPDGAEPELPTEHAPLQPPQLGQLQPYQIVRSLELVLDRIAAGDHAVMPMQRKLLEIVDKSLREADKAVFDEPKNMRALLIYAMSGGNPETIASTFEKLQLEGENDTIARGVLAYVSGKPKDAMGIFAGVDPMAQAPDVAAFLALIKGSVLASEEPEQALKLLDKARLLNPGTLVEEAALRRTIAIGGSTHDGPRFLRAAEQYVYTYLRSPYASQFAEAFVNGVVLTYKTLDLQRLADIVAMMDTERPQVIWLRIARKSAIEGHHDLSAFASARAKGEPGKDEPIDPRALLYSSLATVTSDTVEDALSKLKNIDRAKLSAKDRKLLDAALTIAGELETRRQEPESTDIAAVEPKPEAPAPEAVAAAEQDPMIPDAMVPDAMVPDEAEAAGSEPAKSDASKAAAVVRNEPRKIEMSAHDGEAGQTAPVAAHPPEPDLASAEPAHAAEPIAAAEPAKHAPTKAGAPDAGHAPAKAAAPPMQATDESDPTEIKLAETRKKLAEIDELLGEAVE